MPIELLAPEVAAKIAAGEVVERPASVVKEFIENSLDAGATAISIQVVGGGLDLIRVSDNGSGLAAVEVALAFERHATSKLTSADELASITTLGFRGEALASIAAVSHLTVLTRSPTEEVGVELVLDDGRIIQYQMRGAPTGTTITVEHLFGNVPARLKFVKTRASENGRIQQVVHQYILAYPEVRFTLTVEDRRSLVSGGTGQLHDALAVVFDADVANACLTLPETREGSVTVSGLIGPPSVSRSNRNAITLLVNRRWIQSRLLSFALEEAYRGFLQIGRHPLAVVNINLPYDEVDVNVHPTKSEVRFKEDGKVFTAVQRAVRQALIVTSPVPPVAPRSIATDSSGVPVVSLMSHSAMNLSPENLSLKQDLPVLQATLTPREALPVLRLLGQILDTYIVAEGPDGVYLIDQHAAHERVLYEQVREDISSGSPSVQGVLDPILVDLPLVLQDVLETHIGLVERYGFKIEPFGNGSYLIRGVPALFGTAPSAGVFLETLEDLNVGKISGDREERLICSLACHGAVRAGMPLVVDEMQGLIRQLEKCDQPNTCPHGRPTIVYMSASVLERHFGRR